MSDSVVTTNYGQNWGWKSRSGKQVWLRFNRTARIEGRGAVVSIDNGNPDDKNRIQVFMSDGGQSIRVWRGDRELVVCDE